VGGGGGGGAGGGGGGGGGDEPPYSAMVSWLLWSSLTACSVTKFAK